MSCALPIINQSIIEIKKHSDISSFVVVTSAGDRWDRFTLKGSIGLANEMACKDRESYVYNGDEYRTYEHFKEQGLEVELPKSVHKGEAKC